MQRKRVTLHLATVMVKLNDEYVEDERLVFRCNGLWYGTFQVVPVKTAREYMRSNDWLYWVIIKQHHLVRADRIVSNKYLGAWSYLSIPKGKL